MRELMPPNNNTDWPLINNSNNMWSKNCDKTPHRRGGILTAGKI